jgi:DNA-binding response OmpR family regulator/anti-sigma regulatory factor (Ser/Thr protein kinase)
MDGKIQLSNKSYNVIKKNTYRLQNLVDQLLELSKLESGHVHLNLVQDGIIKFLKSIVYSFESIAEKNNISLHTSFPKELPQAYFDKDKLEKIVVNFLSNAFKYTPGGGSISFSLHPNGESYVIEISDTGKGIQQKELTRIFDRFYRVEGSEEKGSGIGLALAKELIDLHKGHVNVDSTVGQGTTFRIKIPYTLNALPKEISIVSEMAQIDTTRDPDDATIALDQEPEIVESKPADSNAVVLIVEDNPDLRDYISEVLSDKYQIITAIDGLQGERMAIEHIPDIIISDIMMPRKDGYEMCHDLKTNQKTSHIPIIMLTAKAGQESKMEGLSQGADAYLTKPFDSDELLVRVYNLIENQKKIWKHFTDSGLSVSSDLPMDSVDDQFFNEVIKSIKSNLDNEYFSVEDLGREVGFSRSQLHRKLKAIINKSANQLIIEIRLNEARRMLEHRVGTVSEVAFSVGYSSLPYFTRSFKKQFGVLPSKV